jgi:hypothetical protein
MKALAVRCAIYTRVSTDQGLEQDFNSLGSTMIYRLAKHIVWGDEAKPLVLIHELAALL